jgi:acetyl esterase/lipase
LELGLKPQNIALAGDSAGGGLLLAAMLRLKSQQQPLPACAVCLSPWVDLTGTFAASNTDSCAMFRPEDSAEFAAVYLNGASAGTPEASPLFGDLHSFRC